MKNTNLRQIGSGKSFRDLPESMRAEIIARNIAWLGMSPAEATADADRRLRTMGSSHGTPKRTANGAQSTDAAMRQAHGFRSRFIASHLPAVTRKALGPNALSVYDNPPNGYAIALAARRAADDATKRAR